MTEQTANPPAPAWVDGDPLHEAIASAVWEQCERGGNSTVFDDPRNIAAVAAAVARQLLGTEHCIHSADMHQRYHQPANPIPGCPWCSGTGTADTITTPEGLL